MSSGYAAKKLRASADMIARMVQAGVISTEQEFDLLGLPPTDPAFTPQGWVKSLTDIMEQSVNEAARQINAAEMKAAKANVDKDGAYNERNRLVALLARLFPSGVKPDPMSLEWFIVYIDLPTGQASWHVSALEAQSLFADLPPYAGKWDNHTTGMKYGRIERLANMLDKFDVTITPKADQLPEDEPKDFPAEIDATVKVKWADPPVVNGGQVLASVFVAPGQSFTFDQPIMMKALHIGIDPSPYSQPGQGGTVRIFYEDA